MSITKFLFKQIDYWGYIPQNAYHNKNAKKVAKNLVYNDKNPKYCKLDIYSDKNTIEKEQPIFINIHGGGFVAGDKNYRKSFCEYVTKFDVKVLNINYSLAPSCSLLKILEELILLFKWIEQNAEKYHLDSNKIILCGDSAGAYLAACIANLATNQAYADSLNLPKIDTKIAGIVLFSGIYFPTESLNEPMIFKLNYYLWECLCGEKFVDYEGCKSNKLFDLIDCGNYLTADFPPTFVSHAQNDIFCGNSGKKLIEKLSNLKIPYYEVYSTTDSHDWQEKMLTKSAKLTLTQFDNFMTDLLAGNVTNQNNSTITISRGKILTNP